MIIETQSDVTDAVLAELGRAADPRFRQIMTAAVTHLHAFVREAALSEAEFHQACAVIAKLGQLSSASHNEKPPATVNGESIVRLATVGGPIFVNASRPTCSWASPGR